MNLLGYCYRLAILLLLTCHVARAESVSRPITEADAVLAVYAEDWGLTSAGQPRLILAVWKDGYTVWSEDRVRGGAPYHAGQVVPKRVNTLLANLERDGLFADESLARAHFGPDAKFTTILIRFNKKQIKMCSWHELSEAEGGCVAAAHGLTGLNGQPLFGALKEQPGDYLLFRFVWSEIRARAADLLPSAEKPVSGELVMEYGILSWRESQVGQATSEAVRQAKP